METDSNYTAAVCAESLPTAQLRFAYRTMREGSFVAQPRLCEAELPLLRASSPNLALKAVPMVIKALIDQFPQSSFSIEVMPSKELLSAVASHRADLAVGIDLPAGPYGNPQSVGTCAVVAALPAHWAQAGLGVIKPINLRGQPWIRFHPETTQGASTHEWFRGEDQLPVVVASVRVARVACSLVEQGLGFALVDEFTAGHTSAGSVVCLPIEPSIEYSIDFIRSSAPASVRLTDAFFEYLRIMFNTKQS